MSVQRARAARVCAYKSARGKCNSKISTGPGRRQARRTRFCDKHKCPTCSHAKASGDVVCRAACAPLPPPVQDSQPAVVLEAQYENLVRNRGSGGHGHPKRPFVMVHCACLCSY